MKSFLYAFIGIFLYLGQNIIYSLLTGSTSIKSHWAVLISCVIALCILLAIIHNKEKLVYYGFSWEKSNNFKISYTLILLIPLVNTPYLFESVQVDIVEVLVRCAFIGIMEELIFRGFLYRAIEERAGIEKAILLSGIVFGLYHFVNIGNASIQYVILQVIYATALGVVYAVVFSKTKSLLLCMLSHALVDFIGSWAEIANPVVEITATIVCIMCALYYWFIPIKREETKLKHNN